MVVVGACQRIASIWHHLITAGDVVRRHTGAHGFSHLAVVDVKRRVQCGCAGAVAVVSSSRSSSGGAQSGRYEAASGLDVKAVRPAGQTVALLLHARDELVGRVAPTLAIQYHALCARYLSIHFAMLSLYNCVHHFHSYFHSIFIVVDDVGLDDDMFVLF